MYSAVDYSKENGMFKKDSVRLFCILALLAFMAVACGSGGPSLKDEIIGPWQMFDDDLGMAMVFDFKEDGSLVITIDGEDLGLGGSYSWEDDDTIKIVMTLEGDSDEIVGDIAIEGDKLTITSEGEAEEFTRVK